MIDLIIGVLEQSFIYGIVALGSYISYKILNFPDLSVEGTFPLGAAVTAILIFHDFNPYLACIASLLIGAVGGAITGVIHVKLKITDLLSGIIVLTGLYSVNLFIAGKANLPIFTKTTIFSFNSANLLYPKLLMALIIFVVIKIILDLYLKTKSGFLLRSTGDNVQFVTSLSKDAGFVKIMGLALANGLAALSGSVWCQYQRVFDISMGKNVIIIGLASVIIGTNLFKKVAFMKGSTMSVLGCIVYNACIALVIAVGINSDYLNLITAVLFLITLILNNNNVKVGRHKANASN